MEPPSALASVKDGACEIWAPSQDPQTARKEVAGALGIDLAKVTLHVTFIGGGFGRKSKPDFIVEAALLSKEVGAPVKVIWTRDDEIHHGYYHTVTAQHMEGGLDAGGKVTAWLHRSAFPSIMALFGPDPGAGSRIRVPDGRLRHRVGRAQRAGGVHGRQGPRARRLVSLGVATSRTPLRCARLPTNWRARRRRIPKVFLEELIGAVAPRGPHRAGREGLELRQGQGAVSHSIPRACATCWTWPRPRPAGDARCRRATRWASPCIGAS